MIMDTSNPVFLVAIFLLILFWILYGLYLRGMIFGRYNEIKGDKNKFDTKAVKNFLEAGYLYEILWILGIKEVPSNDARLNKLIIKLRAWAVISILVLILIFILSRYLIF